VHELSTRASTRDGDLWARCGSLGWFTLGLGEADGGVGYGLVEEALMFREIGRRLAPGPFLATVLGARVAAASGRRELVDLIASGAAPVGLAQPRLGSTTLDGPLDLYDCVDIALVLVISPAQVALVELASVEVAESFECLDPLTRIARGRLVGEAKATAAPELARDVFLRGVVLTAALLGGLAEGSRDLAVEHARVREQFGKPIGVNQAIKHACTDMAVRCEAASSQAFFAAMTVDKGAPDAWFNASAAKIVATDAAKANAKADIQVHGGMGYTWENDSHLYLKRAHVFATQFGDRRFHEALLLAEPAMR
jgi:alkylation response protein AidB-like acyl-CoA dehydrogenase